MDKSWIQKVGVKKGALHRQVGFPPDRKFTEAELHHIISAQPGSQFNGHTVTPLMKHRARFALNIRR